MRKIITLQKYKDANYGNSTIPEKRLDILEIEIENI